MWGYKIALALLGLGSTAMANDLGFIDEFKSIKSDWYVADYDFSHPMFDTDWRTGLVSFDKGLSLGLTPQKGAENRFAGSSIRREETTHFGRYEVTMRPAKGAGLVTGFFVYTGPYYGTQHDEIDIEFLGQDTTKMHVAWFVDGVLTARLIDLGFDAAETMTRYAFEWHPDALRWYAEDKLIFEHKASEGPIPTVPSRLFLNLWAADPSIANWAGLAVENQKAVAEVSRVQFIPMLGQ